MWLKDFLIAFLLGFSLVQAGYPNEACVTQSLENQLQSLGQPAPIRRWSLAEENLHLAPSDLLPSDYLHELESELGPVTSETKYFNLSVIGKAVSTELKAGGKLVATFRFQPTPGHPASVTIENLRFENPLNTSAKLRLAQNKKGLPLNVFKFAINRLFETAKAAGYHSVTAIGTENYAVSVLYQKTVGMKPVNPKAQAFYQYLDRLFTFSRKHLSGELQVKSLDDFSKLIDYKHYTIEGAIQARWQTYLKTKELPSGMELIKMDGSVIGLIDHSVSNRPQVRFLSPTPESDRLFYWNRDISQIHDPERVLVRELNQ
jgi:hypothetical protein